MKNRLLKKLHVAYALDANYVYPLCVSLCSLLENNKKHTIHCFIMHDESLKVEHKTQIVQLVEKYGQHVQMIHCIGERYKDFHRLEYVTLPTFFRLLLPHHLSEDVKRVLYLDVDMIIDGDISELFSVDLNNCIVGAVVDAMLGCSHLFEDHADYYKGIGHSHVRGTYFNAGMLLIDCQKWREENISELIIQIMKDRTINLRYSDQSALNIAFENRWYHLSSKYNYQAFFYYNYRSCIDHLKEKPDLLRDMKSTYKHAVIYHFSGIPKPWDNMLIFFGYKYFSYLYKSGAEKPSLKMCLLFPILIIKAWVLKHINKSRLFMRLTKSIHKILNAIFIKLVQGKTHLDWYPNQAKKKVLFVQPELNRPSGGTVVNSWLVEALKDEYDITIMSWSRINVPLVNNLVGTSLSSTDIKTKIPATWIRWLIDLIPDNTWHYQRYCFLMRWCKLIKRHYDVLVTVNNECDFGRRGIQYVHFPYLREKYQNECNTMKNNNFLSYLHQLGRHRLRPWRIISGFSFQRMKRNLTLVNSHWTGSVYREAYGADCLTVYPPIPGDFPDVTWTKKENGFVCIGRISGEKRYEVIIEILSEVRKHFPDLHLHIIASYVDYNDDYYRVIKRQIYANADWISIHENITHKELEELVCRHRYGIHGMLEEHFGIAVGEMVLGGCIVFAPNNGGQVEIIGDEPRLLYKTDDEAAQKILHVLRHPLEQISLQKHLASRKNSFTADEFMRHIREIVKDFEMGHL